MVLVLRGNVHWGDRIMAHIRKKARGRQKAAVPPITSCSIRAHRRKRLVFRVLPSFPFSI